jgi:hypothetical protein
MVLFVETYEGIVRCNLYVVSHCYLGLILIYQIYGYGVDHVINRIGYASMEFLCYGGWILFNMG